MQYERTIRVEANRLDKYNELLSHQDSINYDENELKSYETVASWTAKFDNGYEMDVKLCTGNAADESPLWTEAVLFRNGREVHHTEVMDELETDFICEHNGNSYRVIIERDQNS